MINYYFFLYYRMPKRSQKKGETSSRKKRFESLGYKAYRNLVKQKFLRKRKLCVSDETVNIRLKGVMREEMLECPICLQLLLRPVAAECGHVFCLTCAEELANKKYACGICHIHEPTVEVFHHKKFENIIKSHLQECHEDDIKDYQRREAEFIEKEELRRVGELAQNSCVDYWCEKELGWKCGQVNKVLEDGRVLVNDKKSGKQIELASDSRRLARHNHYTKEEEKPHPPEVVRLDHEAYRVMNLNAGFFTNAAPLIFRYFLGEQQEQMGGLRWGFMGNASPFSL